MSESLKGKSLLSMADLSKEQIYNILKTAEILKLQLKSGQPHPLLQGKVLGMIFEKPSTRTRVSFEVAMLQLGGHGLYLSSKDLQLGRGETVHDSAIVLGRYLDGIMARVFKHETVATLAQYSGVPVINGLSDLEHPCQILGDFLTIYEKKGMLEGLKLTFIGDGNNVCHSLLLGCAKIGMHISVAHPKGFAPDKTLVEQAKSLAGSKIRIEIGNDAKLAVKNADVIYTDVWTSMGQETEQEKRKKEFAAYQINAKLISAAHPETIVMHCLPAHRGEEITNEVMDGPHSVVFDEAENRLHAQKAVLALLMK